MSRPRRERFKGTALAAAATPGWLFRAGCTRCGELPTKWVTSTIAMGCSSFAKGLILGVLDGHLKADDQV